MSEEKIAKRRSRRRNRIGERARAKARILKSDKAHRHSPMFPIRGLHAYTTGETTALEAPIRTDLSCKITKKGFIKINSRLFLLCSMVYLGSELWFAYLMSFMGWCASWFIGGRFWDLVMSPIFGMRELKKIVEQEEGEGKEEI
jgi:hypothetical protein